MNIVCCIGIIFLLCFSQLAPTNISKLVELKTVDKDKVDKKTINSCINTPCVLPYEGHRSNV